MKTRKILTVMSALVLMVALSVTLAACGKKATEYAITKAAVEHGSFTVSATKAKAGVEITITPTAATGYHLDEITVYKTGEIGTTVTVNASNKFTMPAYPVTVSVKFEEDEVVVPATIPGAPTGLTAIRTATTSPYSSAALNWDAPADDGGSPITGYRVEWHYGSNTPNHVEVTGTTYTVSGATLIVSNTYIFDVYAINAVGQSETAATITSLGAPFNVAATGKSLGVNSAYPNAFTFTWNAVPNATNYNVLYSDIDGSNMTTFPGAPIPATGSPSWSSYTSSLPKGNKKYYIRANGTGDYATSALSAGYELEIFPATEYDFGFQLTDSVLNWGDLDGNLPDNYDNGMIQFKFNGNGINKSYYYVLLNTSVMDINLATFDWAALGVDFTWDGDEIEISFALKPESAAYNVKWTDPVTYSPIFNKTTTVGITGLHHIDESMINELQWNAASDTGYSGYLVRFTFQTSEGLVYYYTTTTNTYFNLESFDWYSIGVPHEYFNGSIDVAVSLNPSTGNLPYYNPYGGMLDDFMDLELS